MIKLILCVALTSVLLIGVYSTDVKPEPSDCGGDNSEPEPSDCGGDNPEPEPSDCGGDNSEPEPSDCDGGDDKSCPKNEVWDKCPNVKCDADNCPKKRDSPTTCPVGIVCDKPRCVCAYNRHRDRKTGKCILNVECPPFPCDRPHEEYKACPPKCPSEKCADFVTNATCGPPPGTHTGIVVPCRAECRCKKGYYRNGDGHCVKPDKCPPVCPKNEVYSKCIQAECKALNCSQLGEPIKCPEIEERYCIKGCICAVGYVREQNGKCVPEDQCACGCGRDPNAIPGCGTHCGNSCSDYNRTVACPEICKLNACDCKKGFAYDRNINKCVEPKDCTIQCTGMKEIYNPCPVSCPSQKCADIGVKVFCPKQPANGKPNCKPACTCKPNFYRNAENVCVSKDECSKCKDPNEVYDKCTSNCPPEGCDTKDREYDCPEQPVPGDPKCEAKCRCRKGYYRNCDGLCVPPSKCTKKCTGANEIWDDCPKNCPPQTCKSLNQTYHCPMIKEGVCSPGECRCIPGFYRNYLGQCISKANCLKCTGPHEYFSCGVACDNVCKTLRLQNQTNCPIKNKKCNEMCYCEKDYARDENGICIPITKCPPSCPDNEIYNKCPAVKCDADYCPESRNDPLSCPIGTVCDPPRCVCAFNRHRDRKTGKCIPTANCPPFPCKGPNEKYVACPPVCPGEKCSDYINNTTCPKFRIGIVVPCKPQCRCDKGYYRNSKGICILGKLCDNDVEHNCTKPSENNADLAVFSKGNGDFTGKFFSVVLKANPGKSLIMSPFSILLAVSVFGLYSKGLTHDQILKALNFQSDSQIRATFPVLISMLRSQQKVESNIANKIYGNINYPLSFNFLQDTKTIYNAEAENLDFSQSQQSADTINQWVEDQTNNLIKDLIPASTLNSLTRLVVVNALYFKGNWTKKFDRRHTKPRDYHLDKDKIIQVPTMFQTGNHRYSESTELDCKLLEMTYEGDNFSFLILLPNTYDGLEALAEKLTDSTVLNAAIDKMEKASCDVYIPVMNISTSLNLKDPLLKTGLGQMFDETDSGLINILKDEHNKDLYVSAALQKAILKLNEEGTEAAAATAAIVSTTSMPAPSKYEFNVDRPSIFQLRFKNDPLFCGVFVQ